VEPCDKSAGPVAAVGNQAFHIIRECRSVQRALNYIRRHSH